MSNVALRSRFAAVSAAMRKQMEVLLDIEADYELLLDELKEIRYPVASLPAEILSEIFLSLDREPEGVLYACNSPLLLCRICRTWRQIALRTPGLWSTFNVVAESETQKANVAGMAEVWLARAGRLPISLAIQGKLSDVKSVDALLATLKHHSSKVRSLILQTDADEISFLDQHIAPLPALEEISIHPSNSGGGPLQPQTLSLIQSSPRLRTITLKGATLSLLPVPFSTFRLPVAPQVTKLQLWGCTFEEAHQALSALPNLTEATFSLDHGWPQNGAQPALNRLTHPNIQSLNVLVFAYFDPESDWVRLFEFLDLPKLENFRCTGTNESDLASPLLAAFLERSPLLHSIQLGSTGLSAPQPAMFLPLSELKQIRLVHLSRRGLAELLDVFATDASFLPCMESFQLLVSDRPTLNESRSLSWTAKTLGSALARRRELVPGYPWNLDYVEVVTDEVELSEIPSDSLLEFKALWEMGVSVYVGTQDASVLDF